MLFKTLRRRNQHPSADLWTAIGQINIIKFIRFVMFNKFAHSQSTIISALRDRRFSHSRSKSQLKNPFGQKLPAKFPKNLIHKPCQQNMLTQTIQNPEPSCLRVYPQHNRSRFFDYNPLPLSQTEMLSRHPQHLVDTYRQRKLANSGEFGHLSRQSYELPIRMRTYEDIGVTHNQKRILSKLHYKPDPIITGQSEKRFNSSLNNVWRQPRRHRDNGLQCQKVLQSSTYLKKREPYGKPNNKNTSYTDLYMKRRDLKKK